MGHDLITLSRRDFSLQHFKMPDSPFLFDHLALDQIFRRCGAPDRRPRLVHIYSGTFSNTVRYLRSLGIPVSYTVAAHSRRESIAEFEAICGEYPFPHVKEPHICSLYREGVRQADLVIAPSRASAKELVDEGCGRVEVVPHGTDVPEAVPDLPATFCAGYLGQPGVDKGLLYLIKAWGSLGNQD